MGKAYQIRFVAELMAVLILIELRRRMLEARGQQNE